jgi:Tol biopolymer transport system component
MHPQPLLQTQFNESHAVLSADGRWLAYVSDESGKDEVYVRNFPEMGAKRVVSTGGGSYPVWAKNDHRLLYLAARGESHFSYADGYDGGWVHGSTLDQGNAFYGLPMTLNEVPA